MWDETQNLRTANLEVRERLNGLERSWVIGQLVSQTGVSGALWRSDEPRLTIEYDADIVNGAELLDLLQMYGLHARPARLRSFPQIQAPIGSAKLPLAARCESAQIHAHAD